MGPESALCARPARQAVQLVGPEDALRARRCASGAARQARGKYRLPYVYRLKKVVFAGWTGARRLSHYDRGTSPCGWSMCGGVGGESLTAEMI